MQTSPIVIAFNRQAWLVAFYSLLYVLYLLIKKAKIVERVCFRRALLWIFHLHFNDFFKGANGCLPFLKTVIDLALEKQCFDVSWLELNGLNEQLLTLLNVRIGAAFLKQHTRELYHNISVLRIQIVSLWKMFDTRLYVLLASNNAPSQTKLNLAHNITVWIVFMLNHV